MKDTLSLRDSWAAPLFARCGGGGNRSFYGMLRGMRDGELVVPDYQRGRAWTVDQQSAWVGYVLSQAPLPAIFIREVNTAGGFRDEIVDGQQRLTALLEWTSGLFAARLWDGRMVRCRVPLDAAMINRRACPVQTLPPDTTEAEVLSLYLLLNTAGTPHTEAELARVRELLAMRGDS